MNHRNSQTDPNVLLTRTTADKRRKEENPIRQLIKYGRSLELCPHGSHHRNQSMSLHDQIHRYSSADDYLSSALRSFPTCDSATSPPITDRRPGRPVRGASVTGSFSSRRRPSLATRPFYLLYCFDSSKKCMQFVLADTL